jgi:hypothetical protein
VLQGITKKEFNDSLRFMQAKKVGLLIPGLFPQDYDSLPPGLTEDQVCSLDVRSVVTAHRRGEKTDNSSFAGRFGKHEFGGGGGTQVCGEPTAFWDNLASD